MDLVNIQLMEWTTTMHRVESEVADRQLEFQDVTERIGRDG